MDSYRSLTYHIVIGTHRRQRTVPAEASKALYNYIWEIMKKRLCHLYRINGVEDHIHIVCEIHPSIAVADLVRDVKMLSSRWMKNCGLFPDFEGWTAGYGVFSYAKSDRNRIINYVRNQQVHHQRIDYRAEFRKLLEEFGIDYDERYLP